MFEPGGTAPLAQIGQPTQGYKTGTLQQSEHYIWNTADGLGRGATAVVYFGRHKSNGDVCAVKVFHERESRHLSTTRRREIEALTTVQHRNIVKLLALERETTSGHEVLVMEYCSGGSLYNMLEQPQYAYGFPEDEFLLFLSHTETTGPSKSVMTRGNDSKKVKYKHISGCPANYVVFNVWASGMKYLRHRGFIHRDIKPGNIMRYIGEDGRSVYKITDFGAARELQEDETFMSIYGTEEYLFPDMYATAVLRKPSTGVQMFDASVDIWSTGVTIYHVATGQLPFQPYGGRRNAETMHAITSRKPAGVISGIQSTMNGDIQWSSSLPKSCCLSEMLQEIVVKILAGLLENDNSRMWNFDRFFDEVSLIDGMVVLKIFYCWAGKQMLVYLQKNDTLSVLHEKLAKLTDIHAGDQLILWMDKELCSVIDSHQPIGSMPLCISKSQLFLVSRSCMDNYGLQQLEIPSFPEMSIDQNLDVDSQTAKKANAVAHVYCYSVEMVLLDQSLLLQTELYYRRFVRAIVFRFQVLIPELKKTLAEAEKRHDTFHVAYKSVIVLFETLKHLVEVGVLSFSREDAAKQLIDSFNKMAEFLNNTGLKEYIDKIRYRLEEIVVYVEVLGTKISDQEKERMNAVEGCTEDDHCKSKVEGLRVKISNIAGIMSKHRKYRELHSHEQFIHKCEKQKLQEHCVALMSIYQEHCVRNLKKVYASSMKHTSILTKHLARTKKVEQNMTSVSACLQQLSERIGEEEQKCKHMVDKITAILRETLTHGAGTMSKGQSLRSSFPPEGKSIHLVNDPERGASNAVLQRHSADVHVPVGNSAQTEKIRPELGGLDSSVMTRSSVGQSRQAESGSMAKRARTELLDQLNLELASLQTDSSSLNRLIAENSELMKKFLFETSNLKIDVESLNSRGDPDVT